MLVNQAQHMHALLIRQPLPPLSFLVLPVNACHHQCIMSAVLQPELVPPMYEEDQQQQEHLQDNPPPIVSLPDWHLASSPTSQQGSMPRMKLILSNRVAYDNPMPSSLSAREARCCCTLRMHLSETSTSLCWTLLQCYTGCLLLEASGSTAIHECSEGVQMYEVALSYRP